MRRLFALILSSLPLPAAACDMALILAVDTSGSVDAAEYRIQMDGLAVALTEELVQTALVENRAALALVLWSGQRQQRIAIDWRRMDDPAAVARLAREITVIPRPMSGGSTAIGEALLVSAALFDAVPDCRRRVIDVSADGRSNEGQSPEGVRERLVADGITINALVVTGLEDSLEPYFRRNVIGGPGAFTIPADGYAAYPEAILRKLLRELLPRVSGAAPNM